MAHKGPSHRKAGGDRQREGIWKCIGQQLCNAMLPDSPNFHEKARPKTTHDVRKVGAAVALAGGQRVQEGLPVGLLGSLRQRVLRCARQMGGEVQVVGMRTGEMRSIGVGAPGRRHTSRHRCSTQSGPDRPSR